MERQRANMVIKKVFLLLALGMISGVAVPAKCVGQDAHSELPEPMALEPNDNGFHDSESAQSELPAPVVLEPDDSDFHDSESTHSEPKPYWDLPEPVVIPPIDGDALGVGMTPTESGPLDRLEMLHEPNRREELGPLMEFNPESELDAVDGSAVSPIEKYGEAPVDRTPQFLRTVTPLLPSGKMQIDYGLVYSLQESHFPLLIGGTVLARGDVRHRSLFVPLAFRYGLNECTQLFLNVPLGWSDTEFATFLGDDSQSEGGIGDLSFGVTRLLSQNSRAGRSIIGTVRASAPTGNSANPLVFTSAGTGNGVWRLGGDLLHVQNLDPVIMFYGVGYTYSFEEEFSGFDVQLGQQFSYNLGLGFAVNERVTLSTAFLGSYITESEIDGANEPNTDLDLMQLRLAATIARCERLVEPFVTFGLTENSPSAQLGVVFTQ